MIQLDDLIFLDDYRRGNNPGRKRLRPTSLSFGSDDQVNLSENLPSNTLHGLNLRSRQDAEDGVGASLTLERSTLADWVGRAAFELRPVHDALMKWSIMTEPVTSGTSSSLRTKMPGIPRSKP